MDGADLQCRARALAETLPGACAGYPFTDHLLVYKVAGRVFLIVTEDRKEQIVTVKADPARARALIDAHSSMRPGRYLDKRHWISLGAGDTVTGALVEDLVRHSYELVLAQLPASRRDGLTARLRRTGGDGGRHD